jgi:hypothetical protein
MILMILNNYRKLAFVERDETKRDLCEDKTQSTGKHK